MYAHLCKGHVHANVHLRLASLRRHYPDQVHGYDLSHGHPGTPAVYFRSTQRAVNQLVRQVSCLPRHAGHKRNNLTFSRLRKTFIFQSASLRKA